MHRQEAVDIAAHLEEYSQLQQTAYEINKFSIHGVPLHGFQQWADGKGLVDAFQVSQVEGDSFFLLLIDWHRNDNWYLVLYAPNKSTTYAEIRDTLIHGDKRFLLWKYNPLKRDGLNFERKAYFKQLFGSTEVRIPVPRASSGVDGMLAALFSLVRHRLQADSAPQTFTDLRE